MFKCNILLNKICLIIFIIFLAIPTKLLAEAPYVSKFTQLPMSDYKLIYTIAYGDLTYSFEKEIAEFSKIASQYTINPLKIVIIFLDTDAPIYSPKLKQKKIIFNEIVDGKFANNLEITFDLLREVYPPAFLEYKRRVIIGALLIPSIRFNNSRTVKSVNLPPLNTRGFQVVLPKNNSVDANAFVTYARSSIFKYIHIVKNPQSLTLMQIQDTETNTFTFLAYPLNNNQLTILFNYINTDTPPDTSPDITLTPGSTTENTTLEPK